VKVLAALAWQAKPRMRIDAYFYPEPEAM